MEIGVLCGFVERTVHPREFFLKQVFEKLCSGPSGDAKSISAWAPESLISGALVSCTLPGRVQRNLSLSEITELLH